MLPWFLFSTGLSSIGDSLVTNAALLSKVYFPRLLIPLSSALVAVVDFLVSLMLLVVMLLWFQHPMTWRVLAIPFVLLYALVVIVGLGLWAAAISVRYRDFRHLVPFFLQLWIYVSPIGYSSELIPERWRVIYALNPIVGVVEGFRWAVLGNAAELNTLAVVAAGLTSILLLLSGIRFFRQAETTFADVI
jgi:lipopolysaccharide transport system permease protein